MITKETLDNKQLYADLFQDINAAIEEAYKKNPGDFSVNGEMIVINSLNDYFLYIEQIASLNKEVFLRLPVDEDFFEIDANKRLIQIPSSFSTGVSVVGDQVSEIIYFSINRYFDTTDLYHQDIIPVIQWQKQQKDRPDIVEDNWSATTPKFIYQDPKRDNEPFVVFGWPISAELTETSGPVKFNVRFYTPELDQRGEKTGNFIYSFSTLDATIKINPGLNFEILSGIFGEPINKNQLIRERLKNSPLADIQIKAATPIFELELVKVANNDEDLILDLNQGNTGLYDAARSLYAKAGFDSKVSSGVGANPLVYVWEYVDADKNLTNLKNSVKEVYRETTDNEFTAADIYYEFNQDTQEYEIHYRAEGETSPAELGLFEIWSECVVDQAGEYQVTVKNNYEVGNSSESETKLVFKVPYAAVPEFVNLNNADKSNHANLTVNTELNTLSATTSDGGSVKYYLEKLDGTKFAEEKINEVGFYNFKMENFKNNNTATASIEIRVEEAISQIAIETFNGKEATSIGLLPSAELIIGYSINNVLKPEKGDKISAQLYKKTSGSLSLQGEVPSENIDYDNNTIKVTIPANAAPGSTYIVRIYNHFNGSQAYTDSDEITIKSE